MRTWIAAGVVVASLSIVSSHAQTNYLDGWSDPPERSSEGVRPWVDAAGGSWPEPDQPPAAAAVSVVDQLAVARFLAETGIDQDDYRTAALIARRLAAEGIDPADLERLSARGNSPYYTGGAVAIAGLLLIAAWRGSARLWRRRQ